MEDTEYLNGDDVLISINNEIPIIRKIAFKDDLVILQTYNDTNKTEIYSKDEIKILGKIIEVRYIKLVIFTSIKMFIYIKRATQTVWQTSNALPTIANTLRNVKH